MKIKWLHLIRAPKMILQSQWKEIAQNTEQGRIQGFIR